MSASISIPRGKQPKCFYTSGKVKVEQYFAIEVLYQLMTQVKSDSGYVQLSPFNSHFKKLRGIV